LPPRIPKEFTLTEALASAKIQKTRRKNIISSEKNPIKTVLKEKK
jgi:hypothetical protein